MSAYNEILVNEKCPACNTTSEFTCQTHIASSFDGDNRGRFCCRKYRLNEPMMWWKKSHPEFDSWRVYVDDEYTYKEKSKFEVEPCLTTCPNCSKELYIAIEFEINTPKRVVEIGLESDLEWKKFYP